MKYECNIEDIIKRTLSVKSIRINKPEMVSFNSGQFFKVFSDSEYRYLSVSCSHLRKYMEFTKRITESNFSKWLNSLETGDKIFIEGPFGKFCLDSQDNKIAFIAGGIGITPIFSMLETAVLEKDKGDFILFYGNKSKNDIPFYNEINDFTDRINLRVIFFIEEVKHNEEDNFFQKGLINCKQIQKFLPDISERTFFVCGPPKMVENILQEAKNLNFKKLKIEKITGYKGE